MAWHGMAGKHKCVLRPSTNSACEMRRGELSMTEETVDWKTRVTMTGKGGFSMVGK